MPISYCSRNCNNQSGIEAINALKNIKKEKVDPIKHSYLNQFREICYVQYVSNDTIFHATASVLAFFDLP